MNDIKDLLKFITDASNEIGDALAIAENIDIESPVDYNRKIAENSQKRLDAIIKAFQP